jgi:hypothetical protein
MMAIFEISFHYIPFHSTPLLNPYLPLPRPKSTNSNPPK